MPWFCQAIVGWPGCQLVRWQMGSLRCLEIWAPRLSFIYSLYRLNDIIANDGATYVSWQLIFSDSICHCCQSGIYLTRSLHLFGLMAAHTFHVESFSSYVSFGWYVSTIFFFISKYIFSIFPYIFDRIGIWTTCWPLLL